MSFRQETGTGLGISAVIISLGIGGFFGMRGCAELDSVESNERIEMERIKRTPVLHEAYLNANGILDNFYVVGNNIAVVELDGKPVSDLYFE